MKCRISFVRNDRNDLVPYVSGIMTCATSRMPSYKTQPKCEVRKHA